MDDVAKSTRPGTPRLGIPSRRDMLIGGMVAATAGITWARAPRHKSASIGKDQLEKILPEKIDKWHSEQAAGIVLPPPDEMQRLLYDQQVTRTYVAPNESPIMLAMAYGSSQGGILQVHRPEICYPAGGFRISETEKRGLPLTNGRALPCRSFTAHSDTRVEQVLYWTRVGDALPTSWTSQRLAIMDRNLHGDIPDGLLVRVSVITENAGVGLRILEQFAEKMLVAAGPRGRRQLIGNDYAW